MYRWVKMDRNELKPVVLRVVAVASHQDEAPRLGPALVQNSAGAILTVEREKGANSDSDSILFFTHMGAVFETAVVHLCPGVGADGVDPGLVVLVVAAQHVDLVIHLVSDPTRPD